MRSDPSYFVAVIPKRTLPGVALLASVTAAATVAATLLSGCAPAPEPTPTATSMFASEEEAFAAAEEVYRAYNEAVNAERRGDEEASPRDYLVGLALEGDTEARQILGAQGLTVQGDGVIAEFTGEDIETGADSLSIDALVCLDVSSTIVLNTAGTDVTPLERSKRVLLEVRMTEVNGSLVIEESTSENDAPC